VFDWLRHLFQTQPRGLKIVELEAHLAAVDGGTLHGDVEFEGYDNGHWELDIDIEHPAGAPDGPLDLKIDGQTITTLTPSRPDETERTLRPDRGDTLVVDPKVGMAVEVVGPTGTILIGTLALDR